jgi:hypothetical protein
MKNLTKNHKIALGVVALVGVYFAWKHYNTTKPVVSTVVEEVAVTEA